MVVLDADFLILLLHPNPPVALHPKTKQPVPRLKERVEHLIGVQTIYSNDDDIRRFAELENINVMPVWDLPNPPAKQADMFEEA